MKSGSSQNPFLDFLKNTWINTDEKILFNTKANVAQQRRAFSHNKKKIDLFDDTKPVNSPNADYFRNKAKTEWQEGNGPLTEPMTEEKIKQIYNMFDTAIKDVTEPPEAWNNFWNEWVNDFKQAVRDNPKQYLTDEQYNLYSQSEHGKEHFLEEFVKFPRLKETQNRIKSAYFFKIISEMIPKREFKDKNIGVVLQTIANHRDEFSPQQMHHYMQDNQAHRFISNDLKSGILSVYNKLGLDKDPQKAFTEIEFEQAMSECVETMKQSPDYKKMPSERANALIYDRFGTSEAKMRLRDYLDMRAHFKHLSNECDPNSVDDLEHKQMLNDFKKIASETEIGFVQVAITADDLKNKTLLREKMIEIEAQRAHYLLNQQLDQWVKKQVHALKDSSLLEETMCRSMNNQTIGGNEVATQYLAKTQLPIWQKALPELLELRREMEKDYANKEVAQKYFNKLREIHATCDLKPAKVIAQFSTKWSKHIETMGPNAKEFQKNAQRIYEQSGPPLSQRKIRDMMDQFDIMNFDIEGNKEFQQDLQALPESVQETMRQAIIKKYRDNVLIESCFIGAMDDLGEKETLERQAQLYFKHVSAKHNTPSPKNPKHKINESECFESLREEAHQTLKKQVTDAITDIRTKIEKGKTLQEADDIIAIQLDKIKNSPEYRYLESEEAKLLVAPLVEMKKDYTELLDLINNSLDKIADQFIPKGEEDSGYRVKELIDQGVKNISQSEVFLKRPHIGDIALKRHLESKEARDRVHLKALTARTNYFKEYLPHKEEELLQRGIGKVTWVRSPRARRELLSNLADIVSTDQKKYKKQSLFMKFFGVQNTVEQYEALKKIQMVYTDSILEDLSTMNKSEALEFLTRLEDDPMLKPISSGKFFAKKDNFAQKQLNLFKSEIEKNPKNKLRDMSLFGKFTSPQVDVTYGLLKELTQVLDEHKAIQSLDELPTIDEIKQPVSNVLHQEEAEDKLIQMLTNKNQHKILSEQLNKIDDLEIRLAKIASLFDSTQDPTIFKCRSGFHLIHRKYSATQQKAMIMLQDLYLETLSQYWRQEACKTNKAIVEDGCIKKMDDEGKNKIYFEILAPAKKADIFNKVTINLQRTEHIKSFLSNEVQCLNHIQDIKVSDDMHQRMMSKGPKSKRASM